VTMRKFGLIGYPLGHSFSKKYFTEKFITERITDCSYENYPLENLDHFRELLTSEKDLSGLNVTIPYKSAIIGLLDTIDREAQEIGAVNVVKIKRHRDRILLTGYNTDATGIRDSLITYLKGNVTDALVLGTGGSSKAVCYVLKQFGLNVHLVSRERKQEILTYSDIDPDRLSYTQLIVNTTPLGMFPDIGSMPDIDYRGLNSTHILFDLVYNPELTAFLKMGVKQGCTVISGIKMLHSQAEKAWELWNNDKV
jgi:shikimate dehydrogenase